MREITEIALRFPTVTFTATLVLVVGLWTLILLDPPKHGEILRPAEADQASPKRTPVFAAASLVITVAWILSLAGSLWLRPHEAPQPLGTLLAVTILAASLALATLAVHLVIRVRRPPHG